MKIITLITSGALLGCCLPVWAGETNPADDFHGKLIGVQMQDAKTGWAEGQTEQRPFLLRTDDGGKSWTDISPPPLQSKLPAGVDLDEVGLAFCLQDAIHGWAACEKISDGKTFTPELFSTEDGGRDWKPSPFKTSVGDVAGIQFVDREHGFIDVESDAAMGHTQKAVYRTTDGGKTWQIASETSRDQETPEALPRVGFGSGMIFRNAREGWANGSPRGDQTEFFFRTTDAGKTWQAQRFPWPKGMEEGLAEYGLPKFFGVGKNEGVVSVHFEHHDPEQNALVFYGTHDGGKHWQKTGAPAVDLTKGLGPSEAFAAADHGWMLIDNELLATTDRGASWSKLETNLPLDKQEAEWEIQFTSLTQGWILVDDAAHDSGSELLQTADGGHTWTHCFGAKFQAAAH